MAINLNYNTTASDNLTIDNTCYFLKNDQKEIYNNSHCNFTFDDNSFCCDSDLNLAYLFIPILIISLVTGQIIRSFYKSLDPCEKNIIVFLDMAITSYLQEMKSFLLFFSITF